MNTNYKGKERIVMTFGDLAKARYRGKRSDEGSQL